MSVTKLYNKILLREHPDLDPVADASFQKSHSFIFPGDEIVICTDINAPTDIGGTWSGKKLISAKMSIIAKKPNIFSSEFSREFASTRSFELDSFIIPFTSANAPIVPWGSDGYAPNINFTSDRNWALPLGDFRRQIKAFTTHTPSTSNWKYSFWFPIIFDERYWLALAAADNDFYDPLLPQNGKNQKWLRYHDLSALPFGWKIYSRFELIYEDKKHNQHSVISEYNLSNEQTGIQDYDSNPDYSLKSIKTCIVGGTPTVDCFIFGGQNTSCFGYFTKQTAWDIGEKDSLSAVFRIRPSEGGDRLGSRGSSRYDATSDVVWVKKYNPLLTDTGTEIDTDTGDTILLDDSGNAANIEFSGAGDLDITVKGEIDYQKLNLIFPGVQSFTLYCRIYNGTKLVDDISSS